MKTRITRALLGFTAAAFVLGAMPLKAQEPRNPPAQAQAQEAKTSQGQLMRVDSEARTLTIQPAQGSPMVFRYTPDTKVIGADKGVAGLATMSGAAVTVQYVLQDKDNVATQIEIRAKQ
jgi:hypothetical protein